MRYRVQKFDVTVLDVYFWCFIYSGFSHLLQAVTSSLIHRFIVCWICVAFFSKFLLSSRNLASPCQTFQPLTDGTTFCFTYTGFERFSWARQSWTFLISARCLHSEAAAFKLTRIGVMRFSRGGKKTKQRRISHFWKKTAQTFGTGMWMGWGDNEADGRFYKRPKSANRSQAKSRKYSRGQKREENVGLFQIPKKIEQLKK